MIKFGDSSLGLDVNDEGPLQWRGLLEQLFSMSLVDHFSMLEEPRQEEEVFYPLSECSQEALSFFLGCVEDCAVEYGLFQQSSIPH